MTRQYLVGELSILLGRSQAAAPSQAWARSAALLRREAETRPPEALASVTTRAIALANDMCWASLTCADTKIFARQAKIAADLQEFGVCAGLLEDDRDGRWTA